MNIVDKINSISIILSRFDEKTWEKEYLQVVELDKLNNENILSNEKLDSLKDSAYCVTVVTYDGEERETCVVPLEDVLKSV